MSLRKYDKGDSLPDDYRKALIHLLTFQADSEYAGAQRVGENLQFAPRPEEAYRLAKKSMEEYGHAFYLWTILEELGVDTKARMAELRDHPKNPDPAKVNIINAFRLPFWRTTFQSWEDVVMMSVVVTPAAVVFLDQYTNCSYLPWARISERIGREEVGHMGFGVWGAKRVIEFDGEAGRERLQQRVAKFVSFGRGMYGRPSNGSTQSQMFARYYEMGLKILPPEEADARYLELVQERCRDVGIDFVEAEPDYDMKGAPEYALEAA